MDDIYLSEYFDFEDINEIENQEMWNDLKLIMTSMDENNNYEGIELEEMNYVLYLQNLYQKVFNLFAALIQSADRLVDGK